MLIKGNEIKAVNQYYNKQIAHYRSLLRIGKKDSKGIHQTKRMKRISEKRNRRVKDILHKASRKIIDLCVEEGIEVIVVGNHAGWKKLKKIKRGLYRSKNGILMNADINGASNIIRKVYPCMPKRERWSRGTVNVPVTCI